MNVHTAERADSFDRNHLEAYCNIPFPVVPLFQPPAFTQLKTLIDSQDSQSKIVVTITGIGGSGKTSLAHYYAAQNKNKYAICRKLIATTDEILLDSFRKLYDQMNNTSSFLTDEEVIGALPIINADLDKLTQNRRTLLILDNASANRGEIFRKVLESFNEKKIVLVTTQDDSNTEKKWEILGKSLALEPWSCKDSLQFFNTERFVYLPPFDESLKNLVEYIGFPLGLEIAAATMNKQIRDSEEYSYTTYLADIKKGEAKILEEVTNEYEEIIDENKKIKIKRIQESVILKAIKSIEDNNTADNSTIELLKLAACVASDQILKELFEDYLQKLKPQLLYNDLKRKTSSLLENLLEYSLIKEEYRGKRNAPRMYSIHCYVQDVVNNKFKKNNFSSDILIHDLFRSYFTLNALEKLTKYELHSLDKAYKHKLLAKHFLHFIVNHVLGKINHKDKYDLYTEKKLDSLLWDITNIIDFCPDILILEQIINKYESIYFRTFKEKALKIAFFIHLNAKAVSILHLEQSKKLADYMEKLKAYITHFFSFLKNYESFIEVFALSSIFLNIFNRIIRPENIMLFKPFIEQCSDFLADFQSFEDIYDEITSNLWLSCLLALSQVYNNCKSQSEAPKIILKYIIPFAMRKDNYSVLIDCYTLLAKHFLSENIQDKAENYFLLACNNLVSVSERVINSEIKNSLIFKAVALNNFEIRFSLNFRKRGDVLRALDQSCEIMISQNLICEQFGLNLIYNAEKFYDLYLVEECNKIIDKVKEIYKLDLNKQEHLFLFLQELELKIAYSSSKTFESLLACQNFIEQKIILNSNKAITIEFKLAFVLSMLEIAILAKNKDFFEYGSNFINPYCKENCIIGLELIHFIKFKTYQIIFQLVNGEKAQASLNFKSIDLHLNTFTLACPSDAIIFSYLARVAHHLGKVEQAKAFISKSYTYLSRMLLPEHSNFIITKEVKENIEMGNTPVLNEFYSGWSSKEINPIAQESTLFLNQHQMPLLQFEPNNNK